MLCRIIFTTVRQHHRALASVVATPTTVPALGSVASPSTTLLALPPSPLGFVRLPEREQRQRRQWSFRRARPAPYPAKQGSRAGRPAPPFAACSFIPDKPRFFFTARALVSVFTRVTISKVGERLLPNGLYNGTCSPAALCAGIRGGNANNGSNDGLGYVNVNNAVGNANVNYGVRPAAFSRRRRDTLYKSPPAPR